MEQTTGSSPEPQSQEVKIEVVLRNARHPVRYAADTVILRFAPTRGLEKAELCKGGRVVDTEPGWGLRSLEAVGGKMAVQVEGPGGRREGPFEADWVRIGFPPGSQAAIGSAPSGGESRWYVVELINDDVAVWTCRVEEH